MRTLPILETATGEFTAKAGLVTMAHMCFPDDPMSIRQYVSVPVNEACFAEDIIDLEETGWDDISDEMVSVSLSHLISERDRRAKRGILAGLMLQKNLQLQKHWTGSSNNKSSWVIAKQLKSSRYRSGTDASVTKDIKNAFKSFKSVAHLWAAWLLMDKDEKLKIPASGRFAFQDALTTLLCYAYWFQAHLSELNQGQMPSSNVRRWGVPTRFAVNQDFYTVPELREADLETLNSYSADAIRL